MGRGRWTGWVGAAWLLGWSPAALAQEEDPVDTVGFQPEDGEEETLAPVMSFDQLLVATVQASSEDLLPRAAALTARLEALLGERNELVTTADAPDFDNRGYTASLYLQACPVGNYAGCALVVGQRTEVEWVLGGVLERPGLPPEEGVEGAPDPLRLTVHFVDVGASREVVSFAVTLDGQQDEVVLAGISAMFDRVLSGAFDLVDVRGDLEDPVVAAEIARAREALIAQSLAELERTLGAIERGPALDLEAPRFTRDDLNAFRGRDDTPPWIQVGMGEGEYVRFRNSGLDLVEWRRRGLGRQFSFVLRGGLGGGTGPYAHRFEGRVARDANTLQPVETAQVQESVQGGASYFGFEAGFGVLPFLEAGFTLGLRGASFTIFTDEETVGQFNVEGNPTEARVSSDEVGGYLLFAPGPHWRLRPMAQLGFASWRGRSFQPGTDGETPFTRLDPPRQVLLLVRPGVEVQASPLLQFFGRVSLELPLGGAPVATLYEGSGSLSVVPEPTNERGVGLGFQGGVQLVLGPLFGRPDDRLIDLDPEELEP